MTVTWTWYCDIIKVIILYGCGTNRKRDHTFYHFRNKENKYLHNEKNRLQCCKFKIIACIFCDLVAYAFVFPTVLCTINI